MQFSLSAAAFVALAGLVGAVVGETHIVHFDNRCNVTGTPQLIRGGQVLSNGSDYTSPGPLVSAIAYLQTGHCGFNGENCTLIETTLINGGSGSNTDISLISPHKFSVTSGFGYYNGCDGAGADCTDQECPEQYHPVPCSADNVNLAITFCL
ncbi:hypothetical protein GSI_05555 [Ganoderma sinense ZZ0214-1]|uniref:Glycopeptide n=1 Tax=Ganoderma sinense ZZ0214-1 TaxID=1077348 RepID=A0A2G8SEW8_9APHY|nr:hypothetical protein GSI_05555 [Ganoderma sinense ZZ0214-1]